MTLLEWGALGELIGGIAIIVSLIYVGLQIKRKSWYNREFQEYVDREPESYEPEKYKLAGT